MNDIPRTILDIIGKCNSEEISIGCSDSKVYKFSNEKKQMYLKVAKEGVLLKEYNALKWLQDKLPVPKLLSYESNQYDYLLTEGLVGEMVCSDYYISNPLLAIDLIVEGILKYLIDNKFVCEPCFSHGDTSLPNLFVDKDKFIGFIDVGECGIADKWFDLAICEKSIIRNYGKEYVELFYSKLNIKPDREKIDYYLLMMNLYL